MTKRRWAVSIALLLLGSGVTGCAPNVSDEGVLVHSSSAGFDVLSISGGGFGGPASYNYVEVELVDHSTITRNSTDATNRVFWENYHFVVKLPSGTDALRARVHNNSGWSATWSAIKEYDFATFASPLSTKSPTDVLGDAEGRVWFASEFHTTLSFWNPSTEAVQTISNYPVPPTPRPFRGGNDCGNTAVVQYGEAIALDSHGRMWFTEGGAAHTCDIVRNHSRILAIDTDDLELHLYNVPGDRNSVIGLAWDEERQRVWFSQVGKVVSFDPNSIPDDDFDFSWTTSATCTSGSCSNNTFVSCQTTEDCILAEQICEPMEDDANCYHVYPVPASSEVAHVAVHPDGSIWYANYGIGLGEEVGRLDPQYGSVKRFVLEPPTSGGGFVAPYQIRIDAAGDVWIAEAGGGRVTRIPVEFQDDDCDTRTDPTGQDDCQRSLESFPDFWNMSPACVNPCTVEYAIPGAWVQNAQGAWSKRFDIAWFAFGPDGKVFFNQGYRMTNGQFVFWPRLSNMFYSNPNCLNTTGDYSGIGAGIYVSPGGVVWGADFCNRRLIRLTPSST